MEWKFVLHALKCFGFSSHWIQLISQCLSIVSFYVLNDGSAFGRISPARGLRQGDPLSLFLFILASKALSRVFQKAENIGQFHGIQVACRSPYVSHLFFADDLFIFCRANLRESRVVDDSISTYCYWSGQCVNKSKSVIYFSPNTHSEVVQALCNDL